MLDDKQDSSEMIKAKDLEDDYDASLENTNNNADKDENNIDNAPIEVDLNKRLDKKIKEEKAVKKGPGPAQLRFERLKKMINEKTDEDR